MNEDNDNKQDPLQVSDDFFSPTRDEDVLPEDNSSPAAPADDVPDPHMPLDYPTTDDGVDEHEAYDEGIAHAAGIGTQEVKPLDLAQPLTPNEEDHDR